jgi:hypothetical protein
LLLLLGSFRPSTCLGRPRASPEQSSRAPRRRRRRAPRAAMAAMAAAAAARPPTIGDLADELLLCIFAALPAHSMHDRCKLPRVCRRWRALAASSAGAPLWARVAANLDDPSRLASLLRWLAGHGAHVRRLRLDEAAAGARAWEAASAAMALAPGAVELVIDFEAAAPAGLEWWRHLARGLTRLTLPDWGSDALARAGARDALPPSLLSLELGEVGALPPALDRLARLTRLMIYAIGASEEEARGANFLRELDGLRSLRCLGLHCNALDRVPAAVGALAALTYLSLGSSAMRATGALGPLATLSRLETLYFCADGLRAPSALAGLTSLRDLNVLHGRFESAEAPAVEPGPYLASLRSFYLCFYKRNAAPVLFDAARRVVEPLRAATALTALAFAERGGPSAAHLTADRIDDLLAGKPALRRFSLQTEHAHVLDLDLAALRARHPAVEIAVTRSEWWIPPSDDSGL